MYCKYIEKSWKDLTLIFFFFNIGHPWGTGWHWREDKEVEKRNFKDFIQSVFKNFYNTNIFIYYPIYQYETIK